MKKVIGISMGELTLKGGNRKYFEDQLIKQIRKVLGDLEVERIYKEIGKIYIEGNENQYPDMVNKLKKVFGLVYISPSYRTGIDMEEIREASIKIAKEYMAENNYKTFKVESSRSDKKYPLKSPEISRIIGGEILKNCDDLKVDVHKPDMTVNVDVKQNAYIYVEKIRAYGGMPLGTSGRGLLLLSGGIDSPVAGFVMAKRGLSIDCVHYHSYPFTSDRAEEKVKELANILSAYMGRIKFYSVNILNIQKAINEKCPEKEMTIISRRFMMRIAEKIAKRNSYDTLVTGESLGQVASQTIQGINATNSSISLPVMRPLIGLDKVDIIDIARDIETFETSTLPFEDCCTVFLPKHPVTKPRVEDLEKSESLLDVEKLIDEAIENMEVSIIE